ncbi:hypothetical protein IIA79_04810 [bacterium]|nr:hypothetical protein [bacterium]
MLIFLMCCIILALGFDPFRKSPPPGGFRLWQGMWLPFSSIILAFGLDGLNILSPEFSTDLDSSIGGGLLLTALAYVLLLSALHPWQKVEPTSRRDPGASRPSRLMWFMVLLWPIGLALLAMPLAIPGAERILIQVPVLYESTLQSQWIFGFMFAMYMLWWRWRYWGALAWRGSVNPIPPSITAPANGGADAS